MPLFCPEYNKNATNQFLLNRDRTKIMKITFFYTPKPRQFKYSPRFYDPEQEKFEELKAKYKLNHKYDSIADDGDNSELAYFRSRVKSFDRKKNNSDFTPASIFKKKEMPKFNYKPRFAQNAEQQEGADSDGKQAKSSVDQISYTKKISFRRPIAYDYEDESPVAEQIPVRKILIYVIVIVVMLLWIFL